MKKKVNFISFLLITFLVFSSCNNDDDSNNNNQNSAQATSLIVQTGTWRITSFIDSGDDETSDFSSFTFTFDANGTVTAVNDVRSVTGSWSITDDNSNSSSDDDGNSSSDDDFNLLFTVPVSDIFDDLNDDWDFVSVSNNTIALTDVSGGNGGVDFLTFQRN